MAWRPLVKADGAPARPAPYMHVTWLAEAWRHGGRYVVTWCRPSPAPILAVAWGGVDHGAEAGGVSCLVVRQEC